jgi:hypothetical protein
MATSLVCEHCGNEHLVRRELGAVTLEAYARCPRCGRNDRAEKVTAILAGQTQQITGTEQRVEFQVDVYGQRQTRIVEVPKTHTQMSDLARRLGPPNKPSPTPEPRGQMGITVLVIGIVLALLGVISTVIGIASSMWGISGSNSNKDAIITGLTAGVVCILPPIVLVGIGTLLIVVSIKRRNLSKEQHKTAVSMARIYDIEGARAWQGAIDRWNKLYYCHRDDCIFIPEEGSCAPLSKIHEYLYTYGNSKI